MQIPLDSLFSIAIILELIACYQEHLFPDSSEQMRPVV